MNKSKKIIATDLDRTLLPNGKWKKDDNAIDLFNFLTTQNDLIVIYVTGRSLKLTIDAIKKYNIRYPHILIGDVGTTIRFYKNSKWINDENWIKYVGENSPKYDFDKIDKALLNIDGLKKQENEKLNEFKISYYVNLKNKDKILNEVEKLIKGKFDEEIVYSYDPLINKGLLDILPQSATKMTALKYVVNFFNLSNDDVLYCGDSGNDILPLTYGFNSVLVKNADEQTRQTVSNILKEKNLCEKLYIAKGNFRGLNGNYVSGVIEGAFKFGFFTYHFNKKSL